MLPSSLVAHNHQNHHHHLQINETFPSPTNNNNNNSTLNQSLQSNKLINNFNPKNTNARNEPNLQRFLMKTTSKSNSITSEMKEKRRIIEMSEMGSSNNHPGDRPNDSSTDDQEMSSGDQTSTHTNNRNAMTTTGTRSYLKESQSPESFNVDPDLVRVLRINQTILENSQPLFTLNPPLTIEAKESFENGSDGSKDPRFMFSMIHIIGLRKLHRFRRIPQSEKLYTHEYSRIVKDRYGSATNYLKSRLRFDPQDQSPENFKFEKKTGIRIEYFKDDPALEDGIDFKVLLNEWPYALPRDYRHMVVWSRLPLIDPSTSRSERELNLANQKGLSGFINVTDELRSKLDHFGLNSCEEPVKIKRRRKNGTDDDDYDDDRDDGSGGSKVRNGSDEKMILREEEKMAEEDDDEDRRGIDREIIKFIKNRWPLEEGYQDLMWFLNPGRLQSCPGLPHFHVFIKRNPRRMQF